MKKIVVQLSEQDGNAFAIMGRCRRAAKAAGWTEAEQLKMLAELKAAKSYDELLQKVMERFDVR